MSAFRCLRVGATTSATSTLLRPSLARLAATPHKTPTSISTRSITLLTPRRPILSSLPSFAQPTTTSNNSILPSAEALDLLPKISAHPALLGLQIRCGPRDTYNPSHLVRKRRHGFLSRLKTKKGRKLLMRRLKKGRWNLSH